MILSSLTAAYVTELRGQELENRFTAQARRPAVRALFFVQQYPEPLIVNVRQFVRYLFIQRRRKHRRSIPSVFSQLKYRKTILNPITQVQRITFNVMSHKLTAIGCINPMRPNLFRIFDRICQYL